MKRFIIILSLVCFWFGASMLLNNTYSFATIVYQYSHKQLIHYPKNKLLKGESIHGEFTARDDYLGMITLRFKDYVKHDYNEEDNIRFQIKEKGTADWYYVGDYKSGAIENQLQFPFGFPVIEQSNGKTYEFEIISLDGNNNNAVELNSVHPQFTSVHKFTRSAIVSNPQFALKFMLRKISTSFIDIDFLLSSTLYLVPLFIYVFWKKREHVIFPLPAGILFFILIDCLYIQETYLGVVLIIAIGWIIAIRQYALESKSSFIAGFVLLLIWLPLMYFNTKYIQNKLNIWVYFFLVTGTIQAILEEKFVKEN